MMDSVLSFFLKETIDVALRTLSGRLLQILAVSIAKLWLKCLTDLYNEEWKEGTVRY